MDIRRCDVWWIQRVNQNFSAKLWQFLTCHQRNMWSYITLMEDYVILLTNSKCFLLSAAISWSNWRGTYWNSSFGFPKGAYNRGLPSKPTIYKNHLLWMKTGLWCLVVVHFACPMIFFLFHIIMQCPPQFVLKVKCFWCILSRELYV